MQCTTCDRVNVGGYRFHNNKEVKMALREWLRIYETDSCGDRIFKLARRWGQMRKRARKPYLKIMILERNFPTAAKVEITSLSSVWLRETY